jgi:hypothetical protein
MASVAIAFPILPGQADAARAFAQQLMGPRRAEFTAAEKRFGFTRPSWYLQPTPAGVQLIAYLEGDDLLRSFQQFAAAQDPFDVWYREQVHALSGLDMSQPPPGLPEQILDWAGE